jgi:hypothetical protein
VIDHQPAAVKIGLSGWQAGNYGAHAKSLKVLHVNVHIFGEAINGSNSYIQDRIPPTSRGTEKNKKTTRTCGLFM